MSLTDTNLPAKAKIVYREETRDKPQIEIAAAVAHPVSPVAVLVCHGMGQQVRYETLGDLAKALLKKAGAVNPETTVRMTRQQDELLARAEINWHDANGSVHEVHLYEAYWAPLTEGKVTYRDTLRFLFDAAWTGWKRSRLFRTCTFQRWMFGSPKNLEIGPWTKVSLFAMAVALAVNVFFIAVVGVKLASLLKQINLDHFAIMQLVHVLLPGIDDILSTKIDGWHRILAGVWLILWWAFVGAALLVRYFLIEYVGDVAAYISPFKDSKFDELRHQIQKVGLDVAKVIYGFTPNAEDVVPFYPRVILVGHSLGSVVAYDTLNAAINLDNVSDTAGKRGVVDRTRTMITFGSPLDKTAFLFRNQPNRLDDPLREQMVAASQPLIVDYSKYRAEDFRWINIWAPQDVISGSLGYYDDPSNADHPAQRVDNRRDRQASIPFKAHVQYWQNDLLASVLHEQVTRS